MAILIKDFRGAAGDAYERALEGQLKKLEELWHTPIPDTDKNRMSYFMRSTLLRQSYPHDQIRYLQPVRWYRDRFGFPPQMDHDFEMGGIPRALHRLGQITVEGGKTNTPMFTRKSVIVKNRNNRFVPADFVAPHDNPLLKFQNFDLSSLPLRSHGGHIGLPISPRGKQEQQPGYFLVYNPDKRFDLAREFLSYAGDCYMKAKLEATPGVHRVGEVGFDFQPVQAV